jgi:predicted flap endonuclease-1-like 5' DNA nuclease
MRLDYALYGLAIILFAISAITFAMVAEQDGRTIYAVSTAVVGIVSIAGGIVLRPKAPIAQTTVAVPAPEPAAPVQEVASPVVEAPKIETPVTETQPIQVAPTTVLVAPIAQTAAPPPEVPIVERAIPAPPAIEAAAPTTPTEAKSEFSRIRGISEKRATELKANGINTIEDLANASPEDLASKLNVSPKIVKMWIGSAKKLK